MKTRRAVTRRQVLKLAGTTTLAGLAGTEMGKAETPRKKSVIVVGGGIGGLSCAFELMERGHEVTLLEGSRRTGGHVKTIREPLPQGYYADVGAEHFTNPGYDQYRKYVERFKLPVLPWKRRENMYRHIDGKWYTEAQLADPQVLRDFGFNAREIDYIRAHGWTELPLLYLGPYVEKFTDEYQPFGVGLDELDHRLLGDVLANEGLSKAARRFLNAEPSKPGKEPTEASALFRIWQTAIPVMRGLPVFKKEVFHLKGGNQLLPDTLAQQLGDRVHRDSEVKAIQHDERGVSVRYVKKGKEEERGADHLVMCVSPLVLPRIKVTPEWPAEKAFAIQNTPIGMQSRILLVCKGAFWKGDVPSINLETGDGNMSLVYETAAEVPGEHRILMGSGPGAQTPEKVLAAFRQFYPGKNQDSIEQCIVHEWWKEEPLAFGCERHAFPFGKLAKIWPALIEPVGRVHFAGAAYDNLPWGQDAATRSANRVAERIGTLS